jgi:hypothetical protein
MEGMFTEVICALARAALATFLSKELYYITVPTALVLSIIAYEAITRDPLRSSLPPFIGFQDAWNVIQGRRRSRGDAREVVRLSFFGKDIFWVSKDDVMNKVLNSGNLTPVIQGDGTILPLNDKDRGALEKVVFL